MKNFLFIFVLLFGIRAHAEVADLPASLPDSVDSLSAIDEEFPKEFQLASNENVAVFEFPKMEMPKEVKKQETVAVINEDWSEQMRKALIAKGAGEKIAIEGVRYGRNVKEANANNGKWHVQDIVFDERTSRFSGKLISEGQPEISFRGRYGAMQFVPVLTKRLEKGMLITESDIKVVPILAIRVRNKTTLQQPDQVIGKTLRRAMSSGQPIRIQDVAEQVAVAAKSEVEMSYNAGGISVTDRGIALEKGSIGDIIRVKNIKSGAILRAKIEAQNHVSVSYFEKTKPVADAGGAYVQN